MARSNSGCFRNGLICEGTHFPFCWVPFGHNQMWKQDTRLRFIDVSREPRLSRQVQTNRMATVARTFRQGSEKNTS